MEFKVTRSYLVTKKLIGWRPSLLGWRPLLPVRSYYQRSEMKGVSIGATAETGPWKPVGSLKIGVHLA